MTDPIMERPFDLFERAEDEMRASNAETAAALFAMAAEAFAGDGDPAMAATALRNRAAALFNAGDDETAVAAYREAARAADHAGDVRLRLDCEWGAADALARQRQWPAVQAICLDLVPQMRQYGIADRLGDALQLQSRAEFYLDEEEAALVTARAAAAEYRQAGNVAGRLWVRDFEVTILLFLGRTAEAVVTARDNHRVSGSMADDRSEPYHRRRLGEALLDDGQGQAAVAAFAASHERYRELGLPEAAATAQSWLGRAYYRLSRDQDALAALEAAAAVLEAAGPGRAYERDRTRLRIADVHYENRDDDDAVAAYRAVLEPVLTGAEPPTADQARAIERLTSALIRQERQEDALQALAAIELADGVDPLADLTVRAGRCWSRWHGGDPDAGAETESLLRHRLLGSAGLAQAWVMEMAGRRTDSLPHLARAQVLYIEHDDFVSSLALTDEILQHTAHLLPEPVEG